MADLSDREWLDPIYTAEAMRAVDRWAIKDRGVPGLDLMEAAGRAVADEVVGLGSGDGKVVVVCGKGNNGGDGFVAVRHLHGLGIDACACLLAPESDYCGDGAANLDRLKEAGADHVVVSSSSEIAARLEGAAVVVDAVLGTGFSGEPKGLVADALKQIAVGDWKVVAVDVPSGVAASTGEASAGAVVADRTVTFGAAKIGLWVNPGKSHAGEVTVAQIGIPEAIAEEEKQLFRSPVGLINGACLRLYPKRGKLGSKFTSGVVAVVGGSTGLTGAVCLSSEAAMRGGAGYVQAYVPASLNQIFEEKLTEVMSIPVADFGGHITADAVGEISQRLDKTDAVVLGPGIGREKPTQSAVVSLISECGDKPMVIDADGLFALQGNLGTLSDRGGATVLTPHAGELARLLGVDSSQVDARRLYCAQKAAEKASAVVVLKGDDTVVASPDGLVAVNRCSTPGLATGGSGDVLSGITGALLAKAIDPFAAAAMAAYIHSQAGIAAAETVGPEGMIASDVINKIAGVLP